MDAAFTFAIKSTLLWVTMLGNHVQESTMTRKELMSYLSVMDYSVSFQDAGMPRFVIQSFLRILYIF